MILVLNGPNLGRLGTREPAVYGHTTYADLVKMCAETGSALGLEVEVRQTDAEYEMLGWLHEAADSGAAVVLNPGGWTHTSVALRDACAECPVLEDRSVKTARRATDKKSASRATASPVLRPRSTTAARARSTPASSPTARRTSRTCSMKAPSARLRETSPASAPWADA